MHNDNEYHNSHQYFGVYKPQGNLITEVHISVVPCTILVQVKHPYKYYEEMHWIGSCVLFFLMHSKMTMNIINLESL